MARYPRSGNSDAALTTPAVQVREVLGEEITPSRYFWLRNLWVLNTSAATAALVQVYDQDEAAATAANERLAFYVPTTTLVSIDFPEPGLRFYTNVCAATTNGTVAIYQCGASGFEEGQG